MKIIIVIVIVVTVGVAFRGALIGASTSAPTGTSTGAPIGTSTHAPAVATAVNLKADSPTIVHFCAFTTADGFDWKIAATSHASYPGMDRGCTDLTRQGYADFRTHMFLAGQGRGPDPDHVTLP